MQEILSKIKACTICDKHLPHGCRPVMNADVESKIVIIGQAPGAIVHRTGKPWDDKSGENLRNWMGIDEVDFYNPKKVAILPMGFCYPGKGKSGDLPPRKECAPEWHPKVLNQIKKPSLTLLIGMYAQKYYLGSAVERTLTATVKNYQIYLPEFMVLPHPSPRNNIWMAKNKWFAEKNLKELKKIISFNLNN